jgi:hypothetical protein
MVKSEKLVGSVENENTDSRGTSNWKNKAERMLKPFSYTPFIPKK